MLISKFKIKLIKYNMSDSIYDIMVDNDKYHAFGDLTEIIWFTIDYFIKDNNCFRLWGFDSKYEITFERKGNYYESKLFDQSSEKPDKPIKIFLIDDEQLLNLFIFMDNVINNILIDIVRTKNNYMDIIKLKNDNLKCISILNPNLH